MKFSVWLFFLLGYLPSVWGKDETVLNYDLAGSNNWAPYYFDDNSAPGILGEIIPLVLNEAGIKANQVDLPAARILKAFAKGDIDFDVISPSWLTEQEKQQYVFSLPVLPIKEYLVELAQQPKTITSTNDYWHHPVGTVRGYIYHDDDKFQRVDFNSEKELILALATKRIDMAVIGDRTANYWSKKFGVAIRLSFLHSDGMLHFRLRKEHKTLVDRINLAITQLKQQHTFIQIANKYRN